MMTCETGPRSHVRVSAGGFSHIHKNTSTCFQISRPPSVTRRNPCTQNLFQCDNDSEIFNEPCGDTVLSCSFRSSAVVSERREREKRNSRLTGCDRGDVCTVRTCSISTTVSKARCTDPSFHTGPSSSCSIKTRGPTNSPTSSPYASPRSGNQPAVIHFIRK